MWDVSFRLKSSQQKSFGCQCKILLRFELVLPALEGRVGFTIFDVSVKPLRPSQLDCFVVL